MYEYIIHGEVPEGAVKLPPEDIDPAKIILKDKGIAAKRRAEDRALATERCLALYQEAGAQEMDFNLPDVPYGGTIWWRIRYRIAYRWNRFTAGVSRRWHWNVSYPIRMWWHFRFNREKPLPGGTEALKALMLEEFRKEDIRDCDLPWCEDVYRDRPKNPKDKPGYYDLIFNRKRVVG